MAAPEGLRKSPSSSSGKRKLQVLKKGPWTSAEDALLIEYVKKHGEGNWNAVQRNSGLLRCGKSCRLRWANHLRPNLKKGAFSPEEEQLIVDLHAKIGNKWARMASELPGRTDNEIKNYWNTRLKRRLRAGLPVYPREVAEQEQEEHHNSSPNLNQFAYNPESGASYTSNQLKLYRDDNGGLSLSLDASNPLYSSSTFLSQGVVNQLPIDSLIQFNSLGYGAIYSGSPMEALGLPSIQSLPPPPPPPPSSTEFVSSVDAAEDFEVERGNSSGLLEDLFAESQALVRYSGKRQEPFVAAGGNSHEQAPDFGFSHGVSNSHHAYQGLEVKEGKSSPMDDELMNLLDNFPLSVPIPEWNGGDGNQEPSILNNGTSSATRSQPVVTEYNPVAGSANQDWNLPFGSCVWNNMPTIF